ENFAAKLAEKESNKKYYFIDNGLIHLFLLDPLTSLLENIVAVQLRRLYGDDVYFYHHNIEVDFYVPDVQLAVQVCYSLQDLETRAREIKALSRMAQQVEVREMIIITKNEDENIVDEGLNIKVISAWKWLLQPGVGLGQP
ncbi:MAG: ATP-binding protein, partial [Tannerellaceae bacterium]|nr:ATP-binding protein [Tannerellaceae bacterium]